VLRRRTFGLDEGHIINSVTRMVAATVLMAETVGLFLIFLKVTGHSTTGSLGDAFLALVGGGIVGAGTFLLAASQLGSEEVGIIRSRLPALRISAWLGRGGANAS
jgi:hypothetical protein